MTLRARCADGDVPRNVRRPDANGSIAGNSIRAEGRTGCPFRRGCTALETGNSGLKAVGHFSTNRPASLDSIAQLCAGKLNRVSV
jgi:hypothetical protein